MHFKFLSKLVLTIFFLLICLFSDSAIILAQDGAESYSTQDNTASFDSNVSANDVNVDPGTAGYTETTINETANADGTVSYDGTTVVGPEGTTAEVTVNSDGSYTVSFSSPGNDINPSVDTDVTYDSQSNNDGNSVSGGGDTVIIDAPDPNPTYPFLEGGPPSLTASTSCQGSLPIVDLAWTPSPLSDGIVHDWRILKSGVVGTYVTRWRTDTSFRDGTNPPQQVLSPETIYYYRVYGYRGAYRSPLSNIVAVLTPSCAPVVTASCSNNNSVENFNLVWQNNNPNISGFKIYRGTNNDVSTRTFIPPNHPAATVNYTDSTLTAGTMYNYWLTSYKTVITPAWTEITSTDENGNPTGFVDHPQRSDDIESQFSGMSVGRIAMACSTPPTPPTPPAPLPTDPSIDLTITTPTGSFPSGGLPIIVSQNISPVTLNWTTVNASSCTASSAWSGNVATSGTQPIVTSTPGTYLYTLSCSNNSGSYSESIQLNVLTYPAPYIQTTGGGVHTNETINFAR